MNLMDLFFYLFAATTLICGVLVVANPFSRSPVTSAMFLVLTIVSLSGLFVTLHAFFLAAVQILVYAGAVMVLFLFVIMLLDLKEEEKRRSKLIITTLGVFSTALITFILCDVLWKAKPLAETASAEGLTADLGRRLFSQYALPFEILSLLLLVAMIGAIVLSKKELK
jgi:NADH-quinone oxidoreductase subunit J